MSHTHQTVRDDGIHTSLIGLETKLVKVTFLTDEGVYYEMFEVGLRKHPHKIGNEHVMIKSGLVQPLPRHRITKVQLIEERGSRY